jgi:hypothetical protein
MKIQLNKGREAMMNKKIVTANMLNIEGDE